ncbi:MAG: acetylmuramic acid-6-phosphate etherase [Hoeflea sp. BRH_c9]|nr:MAG: acetylmuramic acid-6-phosphate etherase [Hoeflea sp. BRH_c9]
MIAETEALDRTNTTIDWMDPADAVSALIEAQRQAASAVTSASTSILRAAHAVAQSISVGGRLLYCGAGSSGLMSLADALELPGTFGISRDRALAIIAGGVASLSDLAGAYEDDREAAGSDLRSAGLAQGDCVIAVAASGRTPYAIGAAEAGKAAGATVIALANNAGTPLLELADIPILLETPPEPIAGSTRLGAGTAQKIALNTISTMAGVLLGHVHDGMMVNLRADNTKLKERAARIVGSIAGVDDDAARNALEASDGAVKAAVLVARGATDRDDAERRLAQAGQNLRIALDAMDANMH